MGKILVVDASIAHSAGTENATFPTSIESRDFLIAIQKNTFGVVISQEIIEEWQNHASSFSRKWLVQMFGRKRVIDVGDVKNEVLRKRVKNMTKSTKRKAAMEKDCMLLEAALVADNIVFSLDETVRNFFRNAAISINEIMQIIWANPSIKTDNVIAWLEAGAPNEKSRQLGCSE